MKKLITIALSGMMMFSIAACSNSATTQNLQPNKGSEQVDTENQVRIPNPFVEFNSLEAAEELAQFDIRLPEQLPEGFKQERIEAIDKQLIQVVFKSTSDEIMIRKAVGTQDMSGDYNEYAENNQINVNKLQVNTKGNNGKVHTATWTNGTYTFAITASGGIDNTQLIGMIEQIR